MHAYMHAEINGQRAIFAIGKESSELEKSVNMNGRSTFTLHLLIAAKL